MDALSRKHSLAIRWFHWINFPLLALMVWSGAMIYWANAVYHFGPLKMDLPQRLWKALHLSFRLADGMAIHFAVIWLFAINGVAYVIYLIVSGDWRDLLPNRRAPIEAIQVTLHDLRLRRSAPPQGKYNAAQRISYTAIVLMGLGSLLTGVAIYKPVQFRWLAALFGGYSGARFVHFWLTIGYVVFFVVHVAQVIRTGWNNFRAMVIGFEVTEAEDE